MISTVADQGSFKANLDAFQKRGFLADKQREIIEPILEAGHATIHHQYSPSTDDVNTVVDIAECLFETTFIHADKAKTLRKRIPKRK